MKAPNFDDLRDVVFSESVPITVTRTPAPTFVNGRAVQGAQTTFMARLCIQPAPTKDLDFAEAGMIIKGIVKIFSPVELLVAPMPDSFTYKGATWELIKTDDWSDIAKYFRCFAVKQSIA